MDYSRPHIDTSVNTCTVLPVVYSKNSHLTKSKNIQPSVCYNSLSYLPGRYYICSSLYISASAGPEHPPHPSSVILTFKAFLVLLHDGKATWQWHSTLFRVNLSGECRGKDSVRLLLDEKQVWKETLLHVFNSKRGQRSYFVELCAG